MPIDIHTRMITLIGKPLGQSFAARMQNAAYAAAGLNLLYFYTEADEQHLAEIIQGLRRMNFAGFAVTSPNKVAVLRYLDALDPLCEKIGACNTVVRTPAGQLIGYNTDAAGFYTSLCTEGGVDIAQRSFFCIGAGGAGRAICATLAHYGARQIHIVDRVPQKAQDLVHDINCRFAPVAHFAAPGDFSALAKCDVVLNASGVGMGDSSGESPLPATQIHAHQLYFDACYNPQKTRFLLDAEAKGCRILNGLGMSLYQGAAQIELWSGEKAPLAAMRRELLDILAEQEKCSTQAVQGGVTE